MQTNGCPVGGQEVADKIGEILGVKAEAAVAKVARVMCSELMRRASKV